MVKSLKHIKSTSSMLKSPILRVYSPRKRIETQNPTYKVLPPWLAKLVQITPIKLGFMVDIPILHGGYTLTYNWGEHHLLGVGEPGISRACPGLALGCTQGEPILGTNAATAGSSVGLISGLMIFSMTISGTD